MKVNLKLEDMEESVIETDLTKDIKRMCVLLKEESDKRMCKIFEANKIDYEDETAPYDYHESTMFFHIMLGTTVIGYFVCMPSQFKKSSWLTEFYIDKPYRSKGYGNNAVKSLKQIIKNKGYTKLALTVIEGNFAKKLYERLGFTEVVSTSLMCKT